MADEQSTKRAGSPTVGGTLERDPKKTKLGDPTAENEKDANDEEGATSVEEKAGGQEKELSEASAVTSDATAVSGASGSSGSTDYSGWVNTRVDEGTDDWTLDPDKRREAKSLSAEFTIDLEYQPGQNPMTEKPELGFGGLRLFGSADGTIPSIADVFPCLEQFQVNIYCDQDPNTAPVDGMHFDHVRELLQKQVIEPLLAGDLRWVQDVELRVCAMWLEKSEVTGIDQDVSSRQPYQMAYQCLRSPGDSLVIGMAKALGAGQSEDESGEEDA
ncbi:hypothetical protein LTR36_004875 [Oleoguttula mirabilis]|uniref:Uncharacterized protein n=1 Tax=Oleoguttula mirabilis TaxID=1507867 RepID=A0AAV9JGB5_9PEZI|nr:hypothetical protein LTR36_004875 [Oleoguttula mirabilis]